MAKERRRAILMLHGLCSSQLEVRLFARALADAGFTVTVPVLAGYCAAEADPADTPTPPDYQRWIADAAANVDELAATHSEVTICGISLGATLALAVAAERAADLDGLALISTALDFDGWNVSPFRFLRPLVLYTPLGWFYRYRETPPYGVKNERVRAWIEGQLARGALSAAGASSIPTASLREADRLIRHVKRSLGRVRTPALMIHAREDDVASLANVSLVRHRIASDMIKEVIVEDSYHMITLDNDRDFAALKTIQFFNDVARQRAEEARALSQLVTRHATAGGDALRSEAQ
jgi:carboxylesterase